MSAGSPFKPGMSGVCPDRYACVKCVSRRERKTQAEVGRSRFLKRRRGMRKSNSSADKRGESEEWMGQIKKWWRSVSVRKRKASGDFCWDKYGPSYYLSFKVYS